MRVLPGESLWFVPLRFGAALCAFQRTLCAGYFQSVEGQFGCISCDDVGDFYQDRASQTFCIRCPANTQRFVGVLSAVNKSACQCKEGLRYSAVALVALACVCARLHGDG